MTRPIYHFTFCDWFYANDAWDHSIGDLYLLPGGKVTMFTNCGSETDKRRAAGRYPDAVSAGWLFRAHGQLEDGAGIGALEPDQQEQVRNDLAAALGPWRGR